MRDDDYRLSLRDGIKGVSIRVGRDTTDTNDALLLHDHEEELLGRIARHCLLFEGGDEACHESEAFRVCLFGQAVHFGQIDGAECSKQHGSSRQVRVEQQLRLVKRFAYRAPLPHATLMAWPDDGHPPPHPTRPCEPRS